MTKLTDAQIRRLKRGESLSEDGLYIVVTKAGSKVFRQNYRRPGSGTQNTLAHGVYPHVTLARARELRDEAKRLLAEGKDPGAVRRFAREERQSRSNGGATFEAVAKRWLDAPKERGGPAASQLERYTHALRQRLFPAFGSTPIAEVTTKQVLDVVQPIALEGKHETAKRVKTTASKVFRFGSALGLCVNDPAAVRGQLPAHHVKHHPYLEGEREIGGLARAIRSYQGLLVVTRLALELLLLTFVRPGELCNATWSEFELDAEQPIWRIPKERMKARRPHLVPLSSQALALLRELRSCSPEVLLFPGLRTRLKPITTAALLSALARLGYSSGTLTPHGIRGTASTWLNEHGERTDVIEAQLAHAEPSATRAAYNHADYLAERRVMMQRWADAIDRMRDSMKPEGM